MYLIPLFCLAVIVGAGIVDLSSVQAILIVGGSALLTAGLAIYLSASTLFSRIPHGMGGDPQVVVLAVCIKVVLLCISYSFVGYAIGLTVRFALTIF